MDSALNVLQTIPYHLTKLPALFVIYRIVVVANLHSNAQYAQGT